jgi:hypothetical protein
MSIASLATTRHLTSPELRSSSDVVDGSGSKTEVNMSIKSILGAALLFGMVLPAAAQTTEFFIVQDASTKKCTIVDKRPTTTTTTVVGDGTFKTRVEAESAMKTVKVCTSN